MYKNLVYYHLEEQRRRETKKLNKKGADEYVEQRFPVFGCGTYKPVESKLLFSIVMGELLGDKHSCPRPFVYDFLTICGPRPHIERVAKSVLTGTRAVKYLVGPV